MNQVFYLNDPEYGNPWRVVEKFAPRNVYDYIPEADEPHEEVDSPANEEAYQENEVGINLFVDLSQYDMVPLRREDVQPKVIEGKISEEDESTEVSSEDEGDWSSKMDSE